MTVPVILILIAVIALLMWAARYLQRQMRTSWRSWRQSLRFPAINVTDEVLASLPAQWPLTPERWPSPASPDDRRMSPILCRAYARTTASRAQSLRYQAEAMLLAGAALLGVQLPIFLNNYASQVQPDEVLIGSDWLKVLGWVWPFLASIFIVTFGLAARRVSEDFQTASTYYDQAAQADPTKQLNPTIQNPQQGLWPGIKRLFSS